MIYHDNHKKITYFNVYGDDIWIIIYDNHIWIHVSDTVMGVTYGDDIRCSYMMLTYGRQYMGDHIWMLIYG